VCRRKLALALLDRDGQADHACLVGQRSPDRLADPERRVGGELVSQAPVELLGCPDQADRAFLHEVEQRQAGAGLVVLGDRHDQAQVVNDQPVLGPQIAALDPARQGQFLVMAEQRVAAKRPEELTHRVDREVVGLKVLDCRVVECPEIFRWLEALEVGYIVF
jgi:hypothetical protein